MRYRVTYQLEQGATMVWEVDGGGPASAELQAQHRLDAHLATLPGGPQDPADWTWVSTEAVGAG